MRLRIAILIIIMSNYYLVNAQNYPDELQDSINHKRLYTVIGGSSVIYGGGLSYLGFIWYSDQERVPFHLYDDSKGYLQIDKAGHAFGAYYESVAAYHALRWAGVDKKRALLYGGPAGLIFQTPIEIFDGLYEGWGFSWPDMVANTLGATIFTVQEALFDDQVVRMKFSYSPSPYPDYHEKLGTTPVESFFYDYNAHTYWLSANIKKATTLEWMPEWLNFAFGYSANGMIGEFKNPAYYHGQPFPHLERYRQYVFSLDVDWTKIPTKRRWVKKVFAALNILKFPFPAIEFNRIDGIKGHWLYF